VHTTLQVQHASTAQYKVPYIRQLFCTFCTVQLSINQHCSKAVPCVSDHSGALLFAAYHSNVSSFVIFNFENV